MSAQLLPISHPGLRINEIKPEMTISWDLDDEPRFRYPNGSSITSFLKRWYPPSSDLYGSGSGGGPRNPITVLRIRSFFPLTLFCGWMRWDERNEWCLPRPESKIDLWNVVVYIKGTLAFWPSETPFAFEDIGAPLTYATAVARTRARKSRMLI